MPVSEKSQGVKVCSMINFYSDGNILLSDIEDSRSKNLVLKIALKKNR